jgi:ketosteroid isomerase-like protein
MSLGRQTHPKIPREDNENTPSSCPCRLGNQLCFAGLRPTKRHGRSTNNRAVCCARKKYAEAVNNNDAAAVAALYAEDAVRVMDTGKIYGREAIEKYWADLFKQVHFSNHIAKQDTPHIIGTAGNEIWGTGDWSNTIQGKNWGPKDQKGYWGNVFVRQGDDWKILMDTSNITLAPAATPSPTASPMSITEIKAAIEGVYILDEWNKDGQTFRPPVVEGRLVILNGNIMTVLIDTTQESKRNYGALFGLYSLTPTSFAYKYETTAVFTQTPDNISLSRHIPWEGMREFTVKQEGNSVHLQFGEIAAIDFNPDGVTYSEDGKALRVWHRGKPE